CSTPGRWRSKNSSIVFPLMMLVIARFRRQWTGWIVCGLLLVSLGLSVWQVERAPVAAFYLLPSRFWELLLGALLALSLVPRPNSPVLRQALVLVGIVLIGFAVFA